MSHYSITVNDELFQSSQLRSCKFLRISLWSSEGTVLELPSPMHSGFERVYSHESFASLQRESLRFGSAAMPNCPSNPSGFGAGSLLFGRNVPNSKELSGLLVLLYEQSGFRVSVLIGRGIAGDFHGMSAVPDRNGSEEGTEREREDPSVRSAVPLRTGRSVGERGSR